MDDGQTNWMTESRWWIDQFLKIESVKNVLFYIEHIQMKFQKFYFW